MCLAVPLRLVTREGEWGEAENGGVKLRLALSFVPEARAGDWVLAHTGVAIALLSEEEARETLSLLEEFRRVGSLP